MSKGTLLLADDSITIQKVVNLTFADEGIDVVAVGDGDTAAARLAELKPDIVLADVNMPGLTGYQICELIRGNHATKDLPVVLLVGSFEPFDEAEAHRVGASAYMTKPFQSIRQLVSQVTDLMEGRSSEADAVIPTAEPTTATDTSDAAAHAPEPADIESLYQSSLDTDSESAPQDQAERSNDYVDVGMDDEMIVTTFTGDDKGDSASDVREEAEPLTLETQDVSPAASADEPSIMADTATGADAGAAIFDEFSDTARIEPPVQTGRQSDAPANVIEFPEAADRVETPAYTFSGGTIPAATTRNDFDDVDLLEIPGLETGRTIEFTNEGTPDAARGNPSQVVSLSPELMEIIVQKVVEKLSEKY